MTATSAHSMAKGGSVLYLSFDLSLSEWKLGLSPSLGTAVRLRSVGAGNLDTLLKEIALAKKKFGLAKDAPVFSCYEAGGDGFWLHRWLLDHGVHNVIVDSASIWERLGKRASGGVHVDHRLCPRHVTCSEEAEQPHSERGTRLERVDGRDIEHEDLCRRTLG